MKIEIHNHDLGDYNARKINTYIFHGRFCMHWYKADYVVRYFIFKFNNETYGQAISVPYKREIFFKEFNN